MKKVVIDHNIVYSALRAKDSQTRRKLLATTSVQFFTPNYLIVELFKHRPRIVANSDASESEILSFVSKVFQKIHFFNEELISIPNFIEAYHLCKEIDEDDTAYIALSLEIDAEFWTRDDVLKKGLKLKGFDNFFDENEL